MSETKPTNTASGASPSTDVLEGATAAREGTTFSDCPHTFKNSGARTMDEYAARGLTQRRNDWFTGWRDENFRIAAKHTKTPSNVGIEPRRQASARMTG